MELSRDIYLEFSPYKEILAGIRTALTENEGIIKVIGAEGAGKSALCRRLAAELKAANRDVIFFDTPPESADYLYQRIQSTLGLDKSRNFNRALTDYLLAKPADRNKLVVIYDDAEKIDKEIFILIRLLNNIHNDSETLVSQIICGTPRLDERFDDRDLRSLTQYLNQTFTLTPMTREDLVDFSAGFCKQMGISGKPPTNKQLTDIYMVARGQPGKTLELLEHSLLKDDADDLQEQDEALPVTSQTAEDTPTPVAAPIRKPAAEAALASLAGTSAEEAIPTLDDIFTEEHGSNRMTMVYFKAGLTIMVAIVTVILAVVIAGGNDTATSRLDQILADESPLYLDEIAPGTAEPATRAGMEETVGVESETAVNDGEAGEIPAAALVQGETDQVEQLADEAETGEAGTVMKEPLETVSGETAATGIDDIGAVESGTAVAESMADEAAGLPEPVTGMTVGGEEAPAANARESAIDLVPEETVAVTEPQSSSDTDQAVENGREEIGDSPALPLAEAVPATATHTDKLTVAISDWLDAWSNGDFNAYLAAYHEAYFPDFLDTREEWIEQRRSRIEGVSGIRTSYDRFEVLDSSEESALVRFWMFYARGNYADETFKELELAIVDGQWLIVSERNLEVITLDN